MVAPRAYEFGPYRLETESRRLLRSGEPISLTPKAFDTLLALVERRNRVVEKAELMNIVWPDSFVEEANLSQTIFVLRKTLGDDTNGRPFIDTAPRRGYRFAAEVIDDREAAARLPTQTAREPVASGSRHTPALTRLIALPLRTLRADPETDFLAFSIPDAITGSLTGLDSLVVRSSLVAAGYADRVPDLKALATGADVDLVLAGTLLRVGERLRVTAQLLEAPIGTLVWSHTAEVAMGDLFQLQDDLTQRILASLSTPLSARERRLVRHDVPASATAYEYYLRGNQLLHDARQWTVARDLYRRAVEADTGYAPAWAQLGRVLRILGKYVDGDPGTLVDAENALRRALEINSDLSMAHNLYALLEIDLGRAENAMLRLVERARRRRADPEMFKGLVHACRFCGLLDASLAAHREAVRLDPKSETSVIHTYWMLGDYDRVVACRHVTASMTLMLLGRNAEALALARSLEGGPDKRRHVVSAERAFLEGKRDAALAALDEAEAGYGDAEGLYYIACEYAFFGAHNRALEVLRGSIARGFFCFPAMTRNRWMQPLAASPEYIATLGEAETRYRAAMKAFLDIGGNHVLGLT
jgi:DNA-binding winged helix-turn-helix (wHTH) protein/tetratricopeptide (TPR) repeat protein